MTQQNLQLRLEAMIGDHALLTATVRGDKYDFYIYKSVYEGYVKPMPDPIMLNLLQSACYSFCNGELVKNRKGSVKFLVERLCELEAELAKK